MTAIKKHRKEFKLDTISLAGTSIHQSGGSA